MGFKVLFILSVVAIAHCRLVPLTCKQIRAFVDGHNSRRLRIAEGKISGQPAASLMKKMVWDEELQAKASDWVQKQSDNHNPDRSIQSGRFATGENLYWFATTNYNYQFEPESALKSWFSEHVNFTFGPLQMSDFNSNNFEIGHYTQMVWSDTIYLGCAISETIKNGWKKYFVACNYGPGGNYLYEKPYRVSGGASGKLVCGIEDCRRLYGPKCNKEEVR